MNSALEEFLRGVPQHWGYRRFADFQRKALQKRNLSLSDDKVYLLSQLLIHLDLEKVSNEILSQLGLLNLNYILCRVRSDTAIYTYSGQHILSEEALPFDESQEVKQAYLLELGKEAPFDPKVFVRFIEELVS